MSRSAHQSHFTSWDATPWRLCLLVFSETHRAGHWFLSSRGTGVMHGGLKRAAEAFDAALPRLRAVLRPQDHLVVFSLHGLQPAYDSDRIAELILSDLRPPAAQSLTQRLDPLALLRERLPPRLVREIARGLPQAAYNWAYRRMQRRHGDWSRLPWVIQPVDHLAYIYANRLGRPQAEVDADMAALGGRLRGITTPDGAPVIESIARPKLGAHGARAHLLPDLLPLPRRGLLGPALLLEDGRSRHPPRHSSRDGEHHPDGFYIQTGPGIEPGSDGPRLATDQLAHYLCATAGFELDSPSG